MSRLKSCNLTADSSEVLVSVISSASCQLKELDLTDNDFLDVGVKKLSGGLGSPHCKVEKLMWVKFHPGWIIQQYSIMHANSSVAVVMGIHLIKCLCVFFLSLSLCRVTEEGCIFLGSALNSSRLRELDLSYNHPGDAGLELLSALLDDPQCSLEKLR